MIRNKESSCEGMKFVRFQGTSSEIVFQKTARRRIHDVNLDLQVIVVKERSRW